MLPSVAAAGCSCEQERRKSSASESLSGVSFIGRIENEIDSIQFDFYERAAALKWSVDLASACSLAGRYFAIRSRAFCDACKCSDSPDRSASIDRCIGC